MRLRLLLLAAASVSSGVHPAHAQRSELETKFIGQQTPVWCWAASASMALEFLGFPDINPAKNYQCGVVAAAFPRCDDDCTQCETTLDTMTSLVGVLDRYHQLAQETPRALKASFSPNYAPNPSLRRIERSIDLSYPVIAGISDERPDDPADAEHAVLITGYDDDYLGTGEPWIVVRDPYPYASGENPWENAGYPYRETTGRAIVPWRALRDRMNLSSAVFLEKPSA